ncbi:hypothetical protein [Thiomicrorhabdus sp.]|uniref:hypothetical protein n=1 Tax=Thiomicrorhabdus sp. TaxID=2039724 RepID=UPI0029C90329|nr:hypothetical protein [Thiomicrorhabdus sp.]
MSDRTVFRRDWLAKSLAGLFLGFALGLGLSGVFMALDNNILLSIKAQLAMWIVTPVWLAVLSSVFLFRSGLRAWLWLGALNLLVLGVYFYLKLI